MTNYELYLHFVEIMSHNVFDAYIKLKQFKKEYKKSIFYKTTKMPLFAAYNMFKQNFMTDLMTKIRDLTDTETLAMKLTDVINSIDEDSINNLINKLSNVFDMEKLQDEKGDLKILLNQIKDLVG